MPLIASVVMLGWIPAVLYLFTRFPAQQAVIVSFVTGFLFLPETASFSITAAIPALDKLSVTSLGVLLATVIYYPQRFNSFKPGWLDLPMLVWCTCPILSQLTNGLSPLSTTTSTIVIWGLPYFLGRIYLNDQAGLRKLAIGIFAGGLAYAPLCLLEMRISPQLHMMVYGSFARPGQFAQTIRYGGYRPTVFLVHGLWVGVWMMAATLIGIWLWRTGVIKKFWGIPINLLAIGLLITFVLVKSTGAYIYLVVGIIVLFLGKWLRTAFPVLLINLAISVYIFSQLTGVFGISEQISELTSGVADKDRAGSLEFRVENEKLLTAKARQKMLFGWGDSGGARIYDALGNDAATTDSQLIIWFGNLGITGVISIAVFLLLPSLSLGLLGYPASSWSNPKVAPAVVLAMVLVLFMIDSLLNAMSCPVFTLVSGGILGFLQRDKTAINKVAKRHRAQQKQHRRLQSS